VDTAFDINIECVGISHWFGTNKVLYDVNLQIVRGQIVGLVGPSGCGKSTLLRAKIGTHAPCKGEVLVNKVRVVGPGRDRGIVYQQYTLYPFLTAQQNVAFGLMLDQTTFPRRIFGFFSWHKLRKEHMEQAADILDHYGLAQSLHLYPHEMSGGMRQRVAIAQAIVMRPEILLLDEPFGALDEATREDLQEMLLRLYQENLEAKKRGERLPHTLLIVTHELNEALYVGDRVVGLSQYWKWEDEGLATCPGATIVYDAVAPVFHPDEPRDFSVLAGQRQEIRLATFSAEVRQPRQKYVRFWDEVKAGKGQGILAP
jgi:NitT/TauT family transport system ATP-binding protein